MKKWMEKNLKKMDVKDISLIKLASFAAALLIAKLWSPILSLDWYWYLIVFVLACIRPVKKMFSK